MTLNGCIYTAYCCTLHTRLKRDSTGWLYRYRGRAGEREVGQENRRATHTTTPASREREGSSYPSDTWSYLWLLARGSHPLIQCHEE